MPRKIHKSSQISFQSIGHIRCSRKEPQDDNWNAESSAIELDPALFSSESLAGLSEFSHVEVVFFMNGVTDSEKQYGTRHPRGDSKYPLTGVFAQRGRNRPNPIGLAVCRIKSIDGLRTGYSRAGQAALSREPLGAVSDGLDARCTGQRS